MPTIGAKVSEKELQAIVEYANQCGETVSNLIRKAMIRDATLCDSFNDGHEYQYSMSIPEEVSGQEEDKIAEANYNKIRRILGWKEIKL